MAHHKIPVDAQLLTEDPHFVLEHLLQRLYEFQLNGVSGMCRRGPEAGLKSGDLEEEGRRGRLEYTTSVQDWN